MIDLAESCIKGHEKNLAKGDATKGMTVLSALDSCLAPAGKGKRIDNIVENINKVRGTLTTDINEWTGKGNVELGDYSPDKMKKKRDFDREQSPEINEALNLALANKKTPEGRKLITEMLKGQTGSEKKAHEAPASKVKIQIEKAEAPKQRMSLV